MSEAIPAGRIGPTYASRVEWRRQQALLPEELRLREGEEPVEEFVGWGGVLVHVDRYPSPEAPAKLILLHGGGGNGRLLAPFALMARRAGYEAVAPDLPGYGLTVVPDKRSLRYEDWNAFAADFVRAEHARDGRPVVLFGLSIGGLLAYEAAARTRVPAGVVGTCLLDPRRPEVRRAVALRPWMGPLVGPALELAGTLVERVPVRVGWVGKVNAIVNDHRLAREISADFLASGNGMPGGWFRGYLNEEPSVEPVDFDVCPVFLAHPADDRWTPVGVSLPFFDRLGRVETRLVLLENAGHAPLERPGVDQLREALVGFMAASAKRAPVET
jgi:alpha-beta hydrolase superfamily lysophospholipase